MGSDGRSKELAERVGALAAGFLALGLERGARIRAWSLNRPKWALTQLAAAKPGLFSLPSIQPIASANWNWRARRRCCSGGSIGSPLDHSRASRRLRSIRVDRGWGKCRSTRARQGGRDAYATAAAERTEGGCMPPVEPADSGATGPACRSECLRKAARSRP
jgi:hypothetical protein